MIKDRVAQQEHGYRNGHQLLSASLKLSRDDQDTVDRLSDMAGPLRPGETFSPYLTTYPLPGRSHYVVARTWQDLDAPRAGCVLTRSLLVPMDLWEVIDDLGELLALLLPMESDGKTSPTGQVLASQPPPIVQDRRTVELVEAMFLEGRQPIVFFEAPEAEAMAVRILTALWPSLRRTFSMCTFTLAPRKVDGRDFDLVFAPKTARTRFADWPGRRIDINGSKTPRHRWSAATATQIFQSDHPSLISTDTLGVLKCDARGDESALRLSLMWNELAAKAETTPTAVLGMLDILNSQRECAPEAFERLAPLIERAIDTASAKLPETEAWRFLVTLVGKFPVRLPPKAALRKIKQSAARLVISNPEAAFEFLGAEVQEARTFPAIVLAGVGNGLGSSADSTTLLDSLIRLPFDTGLRLIALSAGFARRVIAMAKRESRSWIPSLIQLIEASDRELQRKARRRLAPLLDADELAPLLPPLLDGVTPAELTRLAVQIGRETNFEVSAFDAPLANAARDALALDDLRDAVAANFNSPSADRFLFNTLNLAVTDIEWMYRSELDRNRVRRLLLRLLENATDRSVQAIQRSSAARDQILEILLGDSTCCARQIARILTIGELRIDALLEIGLPLLALLTPEDGEKLLDLLLERALAEAMPRDNRVSAIVSRAGSRIDPRQLVRMAAAMSASAERVGENLIILEALPESIRKNVIANIDELSEHLVRHGRKNIGETAYVAWASMIVDAKTVDTDAQLRAAIPTLAFALGLVDLPVSTLVTATFPVVYAQLLKSKGDEDFKFIPALLTLPLSFFADWDRAKSARRDLAEAFLKSSWPPAHLLLAALDAGIEQKILKRLSRSYGGERYIASIEQDSHRLDLSTRGRVQESLLNFRSNKTSDDWD